MRNLSPKARDLVRAGFDRLGDDAAKTAWTDWERVHPFARAAGAANTSQAEMSSELAASALAALAAQSKTISEMLDHADLAREQAIALENDLAFVADIESEIRQVLAERV